MTFPGFVPHREVPELLRRADLFVMPCIIDPRGDRDGLPNVILEALAHEVPVVATDVRHLGGHPAGGDGLAGAAGGPGDPGPGHPGGPVGPG